VSVASHYLAGAALGILWRFAPRRWREDRAERLDAWAWEREERQNLAGQNPNHPMSAHQQAEARAWGAGFRETAGLPPRVG